VKKLIIVAISLIALSASAQTAQNLNNTSVSEESSKLNLAKVVSSTLLGKSKDSILKQVRLIEYHTGGSTDVSPRIALYLTFYNSQEMMDTNTVFKLGDFYKLLGTKRLSAGIYQVKVLDLLENQDGGQSFYEVTYEINTYSIFSDDRSLPFSEFDDVYFQSSIKSKVTSITKAKI